MTAQSCLGIIPCRYDSSRLPGKALADIHGKSLVQRVWEQCKKAKSLARVIVATDDERIQTAALGFGAEVMMTSNRHPSGTDRIAEVVKKLSAAGESYACIVNIQGDMPFIQPEAIDRAVRAFLAVSSAVGMGTIATTIHDDGAIQKPSVVKVVCDKNSRALYFSRANIPFSSEGHPALKHLGLYLYTPRCLEHFVSLSPSNLERTERLEQLRALEHGISIHVEILPNELVQPTIEVDTPEDLGRARDYAKR